MVHSNFGDWCPYKNILCQEREGCLKCQIYYDTTPILEDRQTENGGAIIITIPQPGYGISQGTEPPTVIVQQELKAETTA